MRCPGLFIPEGFKARINLGDCKPQGRIDKHRDLWLYPVQFVQQLLGSAEGKGGDIHNTIIGQGLVEQFLQELQSGLF